MHGPSARPLPIREKDLAGLVPWIVESNALKLPANPVALAHLIATGSAVSGTPADAGLQRCNPDSGALSSMSLGWWNPFVSAAFACLPSLFTRA